MWKRSPYLTTGAILILSLAIQASSLSQSERRIDPELQRQIDDFVTNVYLPTAGIDGMGLSIAQDDGQLLYSTGYGLANIEKNIPNGNSTQYGLGSLSKSMTSVLVVKILHGKFPNLGEQVLDTPIRKLMPEVNFTLIDRIRSEQTSFRDLLAHRTCIFDQPVMAEPVDTMEEMIYRTRYNEPTCDFRTTSTYSNQMISVAGELVGILANSSYEQEIQELWNELGMLDTIFTQSTDNFTTLPQRAMPYYIMDNEVHTFSSELLKRIRLLNAAGGLYSSPNDMIKFMQLYVNLGNIDGKQIVPRDAMLWLLKPASITILNDFQYKSFDGHKVLNQFGYGLALVLSSYDGWEFIQHGGYYPPYDSQFSVFPGKKLVIYSGTHMHLFTAHPFTLHLFIFDLLRGMSYANAKERAVKALGKVKLEQEEKVRKDEEEWKMFYGEMVKVARWNNEPVNITLGKYGSGRAGDLVISERLNQETNQMQYFMEHGKWYKGWLDRVEGETALFKARWVTEVTQDDEMLEMPEGRHFLAVEGDGGDTLTLFGSIYLFGRFKLGEGLDSFPVIPWEPDSCPA